MSHPIENLLFTSDFGLEKITKISAVHSPDATSLEIYEAFQKSVQGILQTSAIHWINITVDQTRGLFFHSDSRAA